jgi:hypothetical protein
MSPHASSCAAVGGGAVIAAAATPRIAAAAMAACVYMSREDEAYMLDIYNEHNVRAVCKG